MDDGLKVLIVDDDSSVLELASMILSTAGHEVLAESSSVKALSELGESRPDIVLVDIMMPEMDGLEFCKKIRESNEFDDLKLIVISAKAYEFDRNRAYEMGADGFIRKPISPDTFYGEIGKFVDDKIAMTFWGVRGTLPVPGEGSLRYGGNTSCVMLEFAKGQNLIFDAGTGIKVLSNHLLGAGQTRFDAKIFISHPHWDHINALPFFVPMYIPGNEFEILGARHGDLTMRELISAQMEDVYFPITIKEFGARVYFRDLREEKFEIDDISVETKLLSHPGYCLGYRIEYKGRSICYVTDNELYLPTDPSHNPNYVERLTEFVADTNVLITDCTYRDDEYKTKVGWGHSCVSEVVDLANQANVETLYLFHHDPDQDDNAIDDKLNQARGRLDELGSATICLAPAETDRVLI